MDGRVEQPANSTSTRKAARWLSRAEAVNVAELVPRTEVEGPGVRLALWVQGCPMRCANCCNPHLLEFRDASWRLVDDVVREIVATDGIEGVTFLGGEPFAQAEALAAVARGVRAAGLSVMIFTGFTLEYLSGARAPSGAAELLAACDLLVDGPYLPERASQTRRWIGSDNQRVHVLTERYRALEGDGWPRGDHGLEIRLSAREISINGHPRQELIELVELARSLRFAEPIRRASPTPTLPHRSDDDDAGGAP